jgi:hypothetical protein
VGVWRISKRGEVGAPAGRLDADSVGGAEEEDDGLEALDAVCMEAAAEYMPSVVFMVGRDFETRCTPRILDSELFANRKHYNC